MDNWLEIAKTFGPMVGIVLFFIWRDWKREDTLFARVEKLEEYQQTTLATLVDRSTTVLAQNAECFKWVCRVMERFCSLFPQISLPEPPSDK